MVLRHRGIFASYLYEHETANEFHSAVAYIEKFIVAQLVIKFQFYETP
jgi:hypothetical protein